MNDLNSVLIEGTVFQKLGFHSVGGVAECDLVLACKRYSESDGEDTLLFEIRTYGGLAERCHKDLEEGRGIRVAGRLEQELFKNPWSKICIVAERVEF